MSSSFRTFKRALLAIPLRRPSPDRIPRSGDAAKNVDCYTTRVILDPDNHLIVRSADGDALHCLEWDGTQFSIQSIRDLHDLLKHRFEFTHFYGPWTITYSGWFDLAIGRIFRLPYIRAWVSTKLNAIFQGLYNRRKLVTKQRIDLLKVVLYAQLNGRESVSSLSVMSLIHTDRWYFHPNHEAEHHRVRFYLDALAETKDLIKNGIDYQISGHGIAAIERYEEEERKHSESISSQRRMLGLTLVIVLLTVVQAGLIKLPSLLDMTKQ